MKKFLLVSSVFMVFILLFVGCTQKPKQLTQSQIDEVNKAFEPLQPIDNEKYELIVNPLSFFISSTYDKPEDMNFEEFIRYFSTVNMLNSDGINKDEFELLKELSNFPFNEVETLGDMPVPIQRKPKNEINDVLQKYMGITVDSIETSEVPYLGEPYNSFYTFTSDAGFAQFICKSGEINGDIVTLYSDDMILTLKKSNDKYLIVSHKEK
ncbi:MAG: hypothetical protein RR806_07820 [Oscillospiraceae bacterium]